MSRSNKVKKEEEWTKEESLNDGGGERGKKDRDVYRRGDEDVEVTERRHKKEGG